MTQDNLFGEGFAAVAPPVVRRDAPAAAVLAAAEHTASGKRARHAELVLGVVRSRPGLTFREIHAAVPAIGEAVEVSRRLSDLERLRQVEPGSPRSCTVTGRTCGTWYAAGTRAELEGVR